MRRGRGGSGAAGWAAARWAGVREAGGLGRSKRRERLSQGIVNTQMSEDLNCEKVTEFLSYTWGFAEAREGREPRKPS